MLSDNDSELAKQNTEFINAVHETEKFLNHWNKIGKFLE
jgi:hypothetical protein